MKVRYDVPTLWFGPEDYSSKSEEARIRIVWPDGDISWAPLDSYVAFFSPDEFESFERTLFIERSCFAKRPRSFVSCFKTPKAAINAMRKFDELMRREPAIYCGPLFISKENAP